MQLRSGRDENAGERGFTPIVGIHTSSVGCACRLRARIEWWRSRSCEPVSRRLDNDNREVDVQRIVLQAVSSLE